MIQVGSFFPVDLYIDKILVHDTGGRFIFKTFPLHHMTPVAGGIADADKDGLVLFLGPCQCFFSPGIPVDRIVSMLEQVRTGLVDKLVGMPGVIPKVR
jgi:hypothetical protein